MSSGERIKTLIAVNLDDGIKNGDKLPKPPLHITLFPPFKHDLSVTATLDREVEKISRETAPFTITGLETASFGENEDIHVRKVGGKALYEVHNKLMPVVQSLASTVIDMTYAGERYSPHSTFVDGETIAEGEERHVSEIWLMRQRTEMQPNGTHQKLWTLGPSIPLEGN